MIPGCTNTLEIEIECVDLSLASAVYVSINQGEQKIVKTGSAVDVNVVIDTSGETPVPTSYLSVGFTQEETLRLQNNRLAEVQANWLYTDASSATQRAATEVEEIAVGKQLIPRKLP